jgi:hypothetical protein
MSILQQNSAEIQAIEYEFRPNDRPYLLHTNNSNISVSELPFSKAFTTFKPCPTKPYPSLREYILSVCDRLIESYYEILTDFEKTTVCRVAYTYNGAAIPKELTVIKALAHKYLGGF